MTPAGLTCPSCGSEAPAGARFCPSCGASLAPAPPVATERKVVTTLFADLVGFTAVSERHDPEDVDAALRGYFDMARRTIERFGGVVEKYIGDAVVGVFGVPLAHEDDAERAVRAALALVGDMKALPRLAGEQLSVRVAANTGRAVVRRDALPSTGESFLVGDSVNTAARLLEAAPPMGVAVGIETYRLSARSILYEELPSVAAKGKSQPVRRWLARGVVSRRGIDGDLAALTPIVGREVELGVLTGLLDKTIASSTPQFALVAGEAGIGKSRLVLELFRTLEARPGLFCTWRQGRCPPYGDGLSFWALREIVADHAGIFQSDSPSAVEDKLSRAVGGGTGGDWLLSHLRPLVGLPAPDSDRDETFTAWRKFFESLARRRPTIIVIEDVHWASDQTLAFLAHVLDRVADVPLLMLATARPEFFDAHPRFSDYSAQVTRIDLKSLRDEESRRLAHSLPGAATVPDIAEIVCERSGGNPLYTEELVRYVVERQGPFPAIAEAAGTPATIATLIAARLDALPRDHRSLLADAAVVGPVFWPGAVSAIAGRDAREVRRTLEHLEAREFVRRHRESVLAGDLEFAFWHALTREVAYEQLPRAERAAKHAAVAQWIESSVADREADVAELLAYHYWTALRLATRIGQAQLADGLRQRAVRALILAGDGALSLDVAAAEEHYRHAAEVATEANAGRADILQSWSQALILAGRFADALEKAEEAVDILRGSRDRRALAVALYRQADCCRWVGDPRTVALAHEALRIAEDAGPSVELLRVMEYWVGDRSRDCANADTIAAADKALALSAQLGAPPPIKVIHLRGLARCDMGEPDGLEDVRRSIELARERGLGREISGFSYNYAEELRNYRGPREALEVVREELDAATRRSSAAAVSYLTQAELLDLWLLGDWPAVRLREAELGAMLQEQGNLVDFALHLGMSVMRGLARGDGDSGKDSAALERAYEEARQAGPYLELDQFCATILLALSAESGDADGLDRWLDVLEQSVHTTGRGPMLSLYLPLAARELARGAQADNAGRMGLTRMRALAERLAPGCSSDAAAAASIRGIGAELDGDYSGALEHFATGTRIWGDMEIPHETAHTLLGRGRCLMALGRAQEAAAPLAEARAIFARLGAHPALAQTEAVLEKRERR